MEPSLNPDPSDQLAESARGWQRIQLAVLGFIGLCGALWAVGDPAGPRWLQWLAAALAVLSLVLAGLAIYLVGRVAYPLPGSAPGGAGRLRTGIRLTYLAVTLVALGTLSAWWPSSPEAAGGGVEVRGTTGQRWCGELVAGTAGTLRLDTADELIAIPLAGVAALRPVDACE